MKKNAEKKPVNGLALDESAIEQSWELFKAIGHKLRLQILGFINANEEVNVNVIYTKLNLEQSITSQHLKALREVKAVNIRREGKRIYYSLNPDVFKKVSQAVNVLGF